MLSFDPQRSIAPAKAAATVLVVRDSAQGVEVFCVKRHQRSGFLGGAVVFPGGKVDDADAAPAWTTLTNGLHPRSTELGLDAQEARAFAVAALRELLEEAALLTVVGPPPTDQEVVALRGALQRRERLELLLSQARLTLDTASLHPFARWITPTAEAKRFDTRFYLTAAPPAQHGVHDGHETTESFWATPAQVLERWAAGEVLLAPPTSHSLEVLGRARDVHGALALADRQPLVPLCPHFCLDGDEPILALPGDPLYPGLPGGALPSDLPTRFVLHDGRFIPRRRTG